MVSQLLLCRVNIGAHPIVNNASSAEPSFRDDERTPTDRTRPKRWNGRVLILEPSIERSINVGYDRAPIVPFRLPKQARGRIPGAVVPIEQPAPIRNELQQDPDRLAKGTGEMNDGGVT